MRQPPVTVEFYRIQNLYCPLIIMQLIGHSIVYSAVNQRKQQSSASLAFVWWIHRWPVNSPHKRSVTRKMFSFDDVIIIITQLLCQKVNTLIFLTFLRVVHGGGGGQIIDPNRNLAPNKRQAITWTTMNQFRDHMASLSHNELGNDCTVDVWKSDLIPLLLIHDDIIKWKHFPRYWPFGRGIYR